MGKEAAHAHITPTTPDASVATTLLAELNETLAAITGCSGAASFAAEDMAQPRALFAVASRNGVPAGCGGFRPVSADTAELKRLYAHEKGQGTGGKLLRYLETEAARLGYTRIILETRRVNTGAVAFYQNHGYATIPNFGKYATRPEAVCFEKRLPPPQPAHSSQMR